MAKENLIFSIIYKGAAASLVLRIKVLAIKLSKRMGYKPFIVQPYRRIDGAIMITFFHVYDSSINISELQRGGPCELSVSSKREEWEEIRPAWWELAKGLIQDGKIEESELPEWSLEADRNEVEPGDKKYEMPENEEGGLTPRQSKVFELWAEGNSEKEIAEILVISVNTVKRLKRIVYQKLGAHSRREMKEIGQTLGWL